MAFNQASIAAFNAVGVQNVQFQTTASVLARKILIFATGDPLKTGLTLDEPFQVFSGADAGDKTGFGFMAHRLVKQAFIGAKGTPVFLTIQAEAVGTQAAGDVTFTATGVQAGTISMYISGIRTPTNILTNATVEEITDACVLAINADSDLPVTAVKRAITFELDLTSKSEGLDWGNKIDIDFNLGLNEAFPTGVGAVITDMAGGTGTPVVTTALNNLGSGSSQNEDFYTDVTHGYGQDQTTMDAFSTYNGSGNLFEGDYSKLVARPFRLIMGDTAPGTAGFDAQVVISDTRKLDRTNGPISVPGSPNHPSEIAAVSIGTMSRINANLAEQSYIGQVLPGIIPGKRADRWTDDYDLQDLAVKSGISPTTVVNGAVTLQNVVSYYRPDNVPVNSNGFRSMRNISIIQNMLNAKKVNYSQEKWQGISIVADVSKVAAIASKKKAKDINSVLDDEVFLALAFEKNAWTFEAQYTIDQLKIAGSVSLRPGGTGFNINSQYFLSGEGGIFDNDILFDIDLSFFN